MRRICVTALALSALCGSALADPLPVTVYPYVASPPVYATQPAQPAPRQYYVYVPQPRYVAAPASYAVVPQTYAAPAPQTYAAPAPTYTAAVPQAYAPPAPQAYAPPAPQAYAPPAPQTYAAPTPAGPGGGGFLEAIFGGPTIEVPVSHIYPLQPGYQGAQPQPAVVAPTLASAPANPPDELAYPIDPKFMRQVVDYHGDEQPGTIIVDTPDKFLFLVEDGGKALRYGIGVGRPGFTWSGVHTITAMKEWPDWTPPPEMIERQPGLPRFMPGGLGNPLGARALYLGSTLYRIHGSNEPWTIGTNVSSGCIRMRNADVEDLYGRVKIGTKVVVI